MKRRFIAFLLLFLLGTQMAGCLSVFAESAAPAAATQPALQMTVKLFESDSAVSQTIPISETENVSYALFLPADCDRKQLIVLFETATLSVDGKPLTSNQKTDVFSEDGLYSVVTPQGAYSLHVFFSKNLPAVFIDTESGSLSAIHADKNYKEPGTISVADRGTLTKDHAALEYIKGRGNSSWFHNEKKSYNIKFEQKTSLLGMKPAKKWALISNNMDASLLRNAVAYSAAKATRLPYTVSFAFVDLFINGNYRGNYLLCERIEVGEDRISIADLEDANKAANPDMKLSEAEKKYGSRWQIEFTWSDLKNNPENITGGYLLEYDSPKALNLEDSVFLSKNETCLTLHSPKHATEKEISFIAKRYQDFEDALLGKDGVNSAGRHYSEYIDMDSFLDGLLLKEFAGRAEWSSSIYIFLPENSERFYMGPVWDFDLSMNNPTVLPDCIRFCGQAIFEQTHPDQVERGKSFFAMLCSHREFVEQLTNRFFELQDALVEAFRQSTKSLSKTILTSAQMDAVRWNYTFEEASVRQLLAFYSERAQQLRRDFSQLDDRIQNVAVPTEQSAAPEPPKTTTGISVSFLLLLGSGAVLVFVFVLKIKKR
ncbi:MAG: CotH kinase family protein [Clostridia bacterium]|nr:CotH kinase family protein [Clostridia bacterium]